MSDVRRFIAGRDRGAGPEMVWADDYAGFGDENVLETFVTYSEYIALKVKADNLAEDAKYAAFLVGDDRPMDGYECLQAALEKWRKP